MKCEKCKTRQASVFYREIINGNERSMALCEECAKGEQLNESAFFSAPDPLFLSLMGINPIQKTHGVQTVEQRCDLCGMSFREFAKTGKAGCPRCYRTFRQKLSHSLAELHGGKKHVGKKPKSAVTSSQDKPDGVKSELEDLKAKLKSSIEAENFEEAASLRDKIRALEGKEEQK